MVYCQRSGGGYTVSDFPLPVSLPGRDRLICSIPDCTFAFSHHPPFLEMQRHKYEGINWRQLRFMKFFLIIGLFSLWCYLLLGSACGTLSFYKQQKAVREQRKDVLLMSKWLAPIIWHGTYNRNILNAQFHQRDVRIGITVFAIKKYIVFVQKFIETAENFFMIGHKVNYYVFTNNATDIPVINLNKGRRLIILNVPSYPRWQDVSMRRMKMIHDFSHKRFFREVDYLVCVDVDMRFTDEVGVEILSDLFGTLHPGVIDLPREQYTYEENPQSEAYIPADEGDFYYAGGFFGGTVEEVYKLTNFCHNAMMMDKAKDIEAIWHDESYLNKYLLYHKPTKILSPEYLWDDAFGIPGYLKKRRFLAVPKNHDEIRTDGDIMSSNEKN